MSVHVLSGAASFVACLRLFSAYPLAVTPCPAGGRQCSMVLRHRPVGGTAAGPGAGYFVLSQDRAGHFVLRPQDAPEGGGQRIHPAEPVPAAAHDAVTNGMPVPRDGALLGWVTDRQASAILSVHHAGTGPQVRVLPIVGSEPLDWPPFTASPLADGRLWEYLKRGQIVDLAPLLARHPRQVFWVPSQNRSRAGDAYGCVVVRESMTADEYWLPEGVYVDHWILREAVPVAPAAQLLGLPGTVDAASRLTLRQAGQTVT